VLGDLHPHLLALPLVLVALGVALSLFLVPGNVWTWLLAGIVFGGSYAVNSWDMPTIGLSFGTVLLVSSVRSRPSRAALAAACIGVLGALVSLPFSLRYVPSFGAPAESVPPLVSLPLLGWLVRTVGVVVWSRSSFGELLLVHGLFLFLGWLLVVQLVSRLPVTPATAVAATGSLLAIAWIGKFPALVLFAFPAAMLLYLAWSERLSPPERFTALVIGLCWGFVSAAEVFFLRDAFGDRMNTVFKVYFQVWALQAVVLGGALPTLIDRQLFRSRRLGAGVTATLAIMVLGASTYLPMSAYRWTNGFAEWVGLDGLQYVERHAPDEAAAIAWLREHARQESVLLEAPGCSYGVTHGLPHNRISMATGIPTVLGWGGHEYQWRRGDPELLAEIDRRRRQLAAIYEGIDPETLRSSLEAYRIEFVYIGLLERYGMGPACQTIRAPDPQRLEASLEDLGWTRRFSQGDVAIYAAP
jgi:YYY domain-containing protein